MSATPPEAKTEYSRATDGSKGASAGAGTPHARLTETVPAAVLAFGLVGAVLLLGSEFATLYSIHVTTRRAAVQSVTGGSHNSYAFIPIAILAFVLAYGAAREKSRPALSALAVLGIISLLIALLGDLPDAQSSGLLMEGGHFVSASASPSAGMYLETLGAIVLVISAGIGFLLGPPPPRRRAPRKRRPPRQPARRRDVSIRK
jgi:hypothetical protein